ncbi:MAG: HDOD domain-containing protein [bacterium]|nr:HDOD domain-containing protein [bacterium]
MTDRKIILKNIKDVPSLPSVVIRIRQYLNDPNVSFDTLSKVIEHDPGLTANILQLANSAYFGWARRIKSVKEAITRLGTNRIFQMVLCMSVAPLVRKPIKGYDMEPDALWEHSFGVAVLAEKLVQVLKLRGHEEAFTAGLLHDMGKVVLGTFVDVDDTPIKEIVQREGKTFNEAERQVLGIDHAETAGELLRSWNLPDEVAGAVQWHHEPSWADADYREGADLIHCADVLAMRAEWGSGLDMDYYRVDEEAWRRLGLDAEMADGVMRLATPEFEEMRDAYLPHMVPQSGRKKVKS